MRGDGFAATTRRILIRYGGSPLRGAHVVAAAGRPARSPPRRRRRRAASAAGVRAAPTPAGVPVRITSPGSSVISRDAKAMISATGKIMSLVRADCISSPETRVADPEVLRVGDLVGGDERGPERREGVARFPDEVLAAHALEVARGDVVGDAVAGHAGERLVRRTARAGGADHDRELALVVDARRTPPAARSRRRARSRPTTP